MSETYTHFLVTIDETGGAAITTISTAGVVSCADVIATTQYEFIRMEFDTTNNILRGTEVDGTQIIVETGIEVTITHVAT